MGAKGLSILFQANAQQMAIATVLIKLQITLQKSLSNYFYARSIWDQGDYGLAIAILSEATVYLRTEDKSSSKKGMPDVAKIPSLQALTGDLNDIRSHMGNVLCEWEKDNSNIFFEVVPRSVSTDKKLERGVRLNKVEKYHFADVDPFLLSMPEDALERSDSDLARELQQKLNAGEE